MTAPEVLPASNPPAFWPAQPEGLADLDISPTLVQDLFVRTVREQGQSTLGSLRERLKLPHMVLEPVFRQLRQQAYLDVKGVQGNDYYFGLTAAARRWPPSARPSALTPGPRRCLWRHTIAPCGGRLLTCRSAATAFAKPSAIWSSLRICWTNSVPR